MINSNDFLKKSSLRIKQLKNQKKAKEQRKQEDRRKIDTRRYIIIGELVCKHFPEMMNYQPQFNNRDNLIVFAPFENLLRLLSADNDLMVQLKNDAADAQS